MAAVDALVGLREDDAKELVPGVLDRVARLNGHADPLLEQELLGQLKDMTGYGLAALKASLASRRRKAKGELKGAARRELGDAVAEVDDYTYVEAQARLYNHRSGQWVLPLAFAAMQGLEPGELDLSSFHRKRHDVTFLPANPWRGGFDPAQHYSVRDPSTGLEAMNMWTQPRGPRPCPYPVSADAIEPWLSLLPMAGVDEVVAEELYDVLAHKCQYPAVKVNRMVILGGGRRSRWRWARPTCCTPHTTCSTATSTRT